MSKGIQLHHISVTVFAKTGWFLDRISLEWDYRGSIMTNQEKLIDVTASLDRNCLSSKENKLRCTKNRSVCEIAVT